jgi:hypothetical protein
MSFRQRTNWFSSRRGELGFNGFWLAMVCALLLAAPAPSSAKSPLPSFSIAQLSSVAHSSGNDYAVVLWWLQQAQANQSTSHAAPPHSSVISVLCERAQDHTSGSYIAALDDNAKQLIQKLSAPATPQESTFTPSFAPISTLRYDDSRRLRVLSLAPHEALMRSGTSYCRFDE